MKSFVQSLRTCYRLTTLRTHSHGPSIQSFIDACRRTQTLPAAKELHSQIQSAFGASSWLEQEPELCSDVINMYIRCSSLTDARFIFDRMPRRKVCVWTVMIAAYAHTGHLREALRLFHTMQLDGVHPVQITFKTLLNSCTCRQMVKLFHVQIVHCGYDSDLHLCNTLVHLYGKYSAVEEAWTVFNSMKERTVVSWTSMFAAYARNGHQRLAMSFFRRMLQAGFQPDYIAFVAILEACVSLRELVSVHGCSSEKGYDRGLVLGNALITMYAKCGSLPVARAVFEQMQERDTISWNAILVAYSQSFQPDEVVRLYNRMRDEDRNLAPSVVTFITVLNACTIQGLVDEGRRLHAEARECHLDLDVMVGTAMLDMYAKCGCFAEALEVFEKLPEQDDVLWTAIVTGASYGGFHKEAICLFQRMQLESFRPNSVTLVAVLNSCACTNSVTAGRRIHSLVSEQGIQSFGMGTALTDMYGKFGCMSDAQKVFDTMQGHDTGIWNALVAAYAHNGHTFHALEVFARMQLEGVGADGITFVVVLAACSHAGLISRGCEYYTSMIYDHGVAPLMEHCGCMTDLLGRVGWLEEARKFVEKMNISPNSVVLTALLGACKVHGDLSMGEWTAGFVIKEEEKWISTSAPFVVLSSIVSEDCDSGKVIHNKP